MTTNKKSSAIADLIKKAEQAENNLTKNQGNNKITSSDTSIQPAIVAEETKDNIDNEKNNPPEEAKGKKEQVLNYQDIFKEKEVFKDEKKQPGLYYETIHKKLKLLAESENSNITILANNIIDQYLKNNESEIKKSIKKLNIF